MYLADLLDLDSLFDILNVLIIVLTIVPTGSSSGRDPYSFRSSEMAFFDLSRNVVVEFNPITVVVVVSLTDESLFLYGFDGGQYNL